MEEIKNTTTTEEQNPADVYAQQIAELKANTVPRDRYERLEAEKNALAKQLREQPMPEPAPKPEKPKADIEALKKQLGRPNLTDLETWEAHQKLREAALEQGLRDPYLPTSKEYSPTQADEERAQRVYDFVNTIIEEADGDPKLFASLMKARVRK